MSGQAKEAILQYIEEMDLKRDNKLPREEALTLARQAIAIAQAAEASVNDLSNAVGQNTGQVYLNLFFQFYQLL